MPQVREVALLYLAILTVAFDEVVVVALPSYKHKAALKRGKAIL